MNFKNPVTYPDVLNIKMNALMWSYLVSFDLVEVVENISNMDWDKAKAELPRPLRSILDTPMLKNADGEYLVGTDANKLNLTYNFPGSKKAEHLIRRGLYFSLLFYRKLAGMEDGRFRVHFVFGISRYIDCVVFFHPIGYNDDALFSPVENCFVQGDMTIE